MTSPLGGLKPESVWTYFDQILTIPRPSKHEEKILAWLIDWAERHGFSHKQDPVGNLVVHVPATKGLERVAPVILQSHVDMVAEKNRGTDHDFMTDPIRAERDGDWIMARETTLGADNGVGVAMAMAVATDPETTHGPLELLFTVDEETGLTGAAELKGSLLKGRRLINLDTEEDGAFYIGCAGGTNLEVRFPLQHLRSRRPAQVQVTVRGLRGGHSGVDIHENRANAVKLLVRVLRAARDEGILFDLASLEGGSKHNAIPREAFASLRLAESDLPGLRKIARARQRIFKEEFGRIDPDLVVEVRKSPVGPQVLSADLRDRLLTALLATPHGVLAMSRDVAGLVETSNNLAVVKVGARAIEITLSTRSSVMPALWATARQIGAIYELAGAKVTQEGGYPGWAPNPDSELLKTGRRVFKELFKREPEVRAIHAGLECGIIGEKIPGIDMISVGPEIHSPHAPGEKVQISSVENSWRLLKAYLAALTA